MVWYRWSRGLPFASYGVCTFRAARGNEHGPNASSDLVSNSRDESTNECWSELRCVRSFFEQLVHGLLSIAEIGLLEAVECGGEIENTAFCCTG